jgi:polysaccharide pyruvyl transferase WcaK-like protein
MSGSILSSHRPKKIGILGYYSGGNLGDETVVAILIKTIRDYYPNAELFGFSLRPANTERRHGIRSFPVRHQVESSFSPRPLSRSTVEGRPDPVTRLKNLLKKYPRLLALLKELIFLRRSFQRLKGLDLLIVPGSGPLTDWWGGPWTHPYSLLSWALLAKMTGTKFVALSIGSERLTTRLGKAFCRLALSMAAYRSFRDRYSRDTMQALGLKGANPVVPDQGFGLLGLMDAKLSENAMSAAELDAGLVVGVCPVGEVCCVAPGADSGSYERYRENLTAFLLWLIREGYRIAFCQTDDGYDRSLVQQLICAIEGECSREDVKRRIIHHPMVTTKDLVAQLLRCDIIVASRYHAVVLPFVLQKPVLAISYERKIGDLMSAAGLAEYHLPMDKAEVGEMIRRFRKLEENRHPIAEHLGAVVSGYRSTLARQYEAVFGRFK